MRFVAMGICLALGIGAGITVGKEIADVFVEPRWLPLTAGGAVAAVVFAALFFPLFRPIADLVRDRLFAVSRQARTTRTGSGLDEIPLRREDGPAPQLATCRVCGLPGKPVCDACSLKLKREARSKR
jgi:hypothetical protein